MTLSPRRASPSRAAAAAPVRHALIAAVAAPGSALADDCADGGVVCLSAGWAARERQTWYTPTEGARPIPEAWALDLRGANGAPFLTRERLTGYGCPWENGAAWPIGFPIDTDDDRQRRVGMNCAACHAAEIAHDDVEVTFAFAAGTPREEARVVPGNDNAGHVCGEALCTDSTAPSASESDDCKALLDDLKSL